MTNELYSFFRSLVVSLSEEQLNKLIDFLQMLEAEEEKAVQ